MSEPKIILKQMEAIVVESLNLETTTCNICKNELNDFPVKYFNFNNSYHAPLCKGKCGHVFHKFCLDKTKKNDQQVCPTCCVPWIVEDKNYGNNISWMKFIKSEAFKKNVTLTSI
tara:strand:+ start:224 stop:568 length:345 start_codon:yes stop_codon:yes gene_type:complete